MTLCYQSTPREGSAMPSIPTMQGAVDATRLGATLMREHVFLVSPDHLTNYGHGTRWDEHERWRDAVGKLQELWHSGADTIVDQTLPGNGRDVPPLVGVAAEVGLNIVVTTSYHILDELPQHYQWRGPDPVRGKPVLLVEDFVRDIADGDRGHRRASRPAQVLRRCQGMTSGVRRVAAVAQAHLRAGVPVSVHTDSATRSALAALDFFPKESVDLSRVMISHADDSTDGWAATLIALLSHRYADRIALPRHRVLRRLAGRRPRAVPRPVPPRLALPLHPGHRAAEAICGGGRAGADHADARAQPAELLVQHVGMTAGPFRRSDPGPERPLR